MATPVVLPFAGPPGGSVPAARGHPHQFLKPEIPPRLRDLTGLVYDGLDPAAKEALFTERRQPRAKDKPVIRE